MDKETLTFLLQYIGRIKLAEEIKMTYPELTSTEKTFTAGYIEGLQRTIEVIEKNIP